MRRKAAVLALTAAISACMSLTALAAGWSKDGEEHIWLKDDGTRAVNEWVEDQGKWYFFEDRGWMVTGWWPVNGNWYYLRTEGSDTGAAIMGQTVGGRSFDENGVYVPAVRPADNPPDNGHDYYRNITADKIQRSEDICWLEAAQILNDPSLDTDFKKVKAAYGTVLKYMSKDGIMEPAEADYRSPAGVFTSGYWTCAGATRALGRLLDYMGYPWLHANPGEDIHQWCILMMDGQQGYADPQGMQIGYGFHVYDKGSEMKLEGNLDLSAAADAGAAAAASYMAGAAVPTAGGYDPARPLARMIDQWHLNLDPASPNYRSKYRGWGYKANGDMIAWLTGQEGLLPEINQDVESIEGAAIMRDFLNTFDIENASEMERAKKFGEFLKSIEIDPQYTQGFNGHTPMYNFLVHRKAANMWMYASSAAELAEFFGLAACPTMSHTFTTGVAVRVDGKPYWAKGLQGFDFTTDYWHRLDHFNWDPLSGYALEMLDWSDGQEECWRPVRDEPDNPSNPMIHYVQEK